MQNKSFESIISDSDLKSYSNCSHEFYLTKLEGKTKIPISANSAASMFFLSKRKNLFEVFDKKRGLLFDNQRRAGPYLKDIQEMNKGELGQYTHFKSPETFGGGLKGIWLHLLENETYRNSPIYFGFSGEQWAIANKLIKSGKNYFNFLLKYGAPIMGLVDKERTFMFEGLQFKVKIPEIRIINGRKSNNTKDYRIFLDDPKFSEFRGERIDGRVTDVNKSSIVTLRMYGLSKLLHKYPVPYLVKLEAPYNFWDFIQSDKDLILKNLFYREINCFKGSVSVTKREDKSIDNLRQLIENHVVGIAKEKFAPNLNSCFNCQYNCLGLNGNPLCKHRNKEISPSVPEHYFNPKNFRIGEIKERDNLNLVGKIEKTNETAVRGKPMLVSVSHEVARCELKFENFVYGSKVETSYFSEVPGINFSRKNYGSFETKLLEKVNNSLQEITDNSKKGLLNFINFGRDFNCAGKEKIRKKLIELGYVSSDGEVFIKNYTSQIKKSG